MPRRTKEWWASLTKDERSWLSFAERGLKQSQHHSAYLPEDCSECKICGEPVTSCTDTCKHCGNEYERIIEKADNTIKAGKESDNAV